MPIEGPRLQRAFSTFPDGLPGAGLLLLRIAAGIALLIQGVAYFSDGPGLGFQALTAAILSLAIGGLFFVGYLTPFAGVMAGLFYVGNSFSWFPAPNRDLFEAKPAAVLATVIAVALVFLGPGAFSLDARLFGRREIIIPDAPRRP
jgi:uncharacterized membrane protein YphA (DoxX/SURF4 family)